MMKALLYIWQLPQHLLGLLLILFIGAKRQDKFESARLYTTDVPIGVSLGMYIILWNKSDALPTIHHEYGHTLQSLMLGPLYLPIVGIPSLTMNLLSRARILKMDNYYYRWPETWADKLGGVQR